MFGNRPAGLIGALMLLSLSACASPGGTEPAPAARTSDAAARGFRFADTHCSACHAIGTLAVSPNPEAPTFETVVNTPELTSATLTAWLRRSHNYPQIMSFEIEPDQIDDLAAHMMTLRKSQ